RDGVAGGDQLRPAAAARFGKALELRDTLAPYRDRLLELPLVGAMGFAKRTETGQTRAEPFDRRLRLRQFLLVLTPRGRVDSVEGLTHLDALKLVNEQLNAAGEHCPVLPPRRRHVFESPGNAQGLLDSARLNGDETDSKVRSHGGRDHVKVRIRGDLGMILRDVRFGAALASATTGGERNRHAEPAANDCLGQQLHG
ncbi:MAG: hypothetical protein VYC34_06875, partial [Planctomycetota bacterium]|nr:hypothetical protein [Planctomycetota bacterium]